MQSQLKPVGIKLSLQERERLKKLGEQKQRSAHWLAKEAISQYLDREEAAEQFRQETLNRWEEYCTTGATIPNDSVMAWLDSWGTDKEQKTPA
ncbi:MAG: CopG family transcriptional regulator [Nitrospirae bacterium]|nr:CopG family transcriptional regulator [Nitrospirota bacterium]